MKDDIKNHVTHAGPDYQGPAKLSDFASLIFNNTLTKLLACLTLRKLVIPLYYPAKLLIPLS